jgi:two-component system response regulator PilR (NtrC family)
MLEHVGVVDLPKAAAAGPEKTDDLSLDSFMGDIEKQMLEDALKAARYNKTKAAENLGISFRSFRYKLKKFGID